MFVYWDFLLRYLTASKRLVYYYVLEDIWNCELEKDMQKEGKLLFCGYERGEEYYYMYRVIFLCKKSSNTSYYRLEE